MDSGYVTTAELATLKLTIKWRKWGGVLLLLLCMTFLGTSSFLIYHHLEYKNKIIEDTKQELIELTNEGVRQIDKILARTEAAADALARGLTDGSVNKNNMHGKLKTMLEADVNFYGGTITFSPFGYAPDVRLYSAYYSKSGKNGELEYAQLDEIYDYTTPEYDWYVDPMENGNMWSQPYWDEAGKTFMVTYSAKFYKKDEATGEEVANGVVTVDISMNQVKNIIESLNIDKNGFGALTTSEGNYLYHPKYEYVLSHKNLLTISRERNDKDRIEIAKLAAKKQGGVFDHVSTTTGEESWLIVAPVPISGWSLQNTFIKNDIAINIGHIRQQLVWIVSSLILFLTFFCALVLNIKHGNPKKLWFLAIFTSTLLATGVGFTWNLALNYTAPVNGSGIKISDKRTLNSLMSGYETRSLKKHLPPPIYVPTGIYIDALELKKANEVTVSGRIWQKYPTNYPAEMSKDFQFGRAKNSKVTELDSFNNDNGEEVIHRQFQVDLLTEFDYSRYPLEVEHIDIKLMPWATDQNVIFVPDLDSYQFIAPALLPGLSKDVFIPGWDITGTFFMLKKTLKTTSFGVARNFDQEIFPDLHFEISVKRIFIDAFISNLTPLIVVTIILFSVSLLPTSIEISRILGVCVSVFFVVVFSHLAIRKNISSGEIFYLEYFFFVIYVTLLLVPVNAFRDVLGIRSRFLEYRNGLIHKVMYWPGVLAVFYTITAWKFY
jgi:hypothetical protein